MIFRPFSCLSICLALIFFNASQASNLTDSPAWTLVKDKQGIQVFTHKTTDRDILKVKTQITINADIHQIQAILNDISHRKNWIPYLNNSTIIYSFSATEKLEHAHFSAPWPASDRDFVYRIRLLHEDKNKLIYYMTSEDSPLLPVHNDIIRAKLIESRYTLSALNEQQTQVELIFHADPKGWLPVWIINIIQKTLPYLILRNLRDQLAKKAL
ncbi:MAG: START domain-containing protein [Gammaproteobacteria bacterium]|nr:START domain-containing protein [Gammaproteobacteria bacterium]